MNLKNLVGGLLLVVALCGAYFSYAGWPTFGGSGNGGEARYQLSVSNDGSAYVLDTHTGKLWLRTVTRTYDMGTNESPSFDLVWKRPSTVHFSPTGEDTSKGSGNE
jgi:hypothetical protein